MKEGDINAPPILIYDDNDDAITTHFDFHYTDKVWHGEGVPISNLKLLQGCNCDGVCNPHLKECQCVSRQSKHVPGRTGFIYNKIGQLIEKLHYPIFECNTFCACGEKCENRVSSLTNLLESIDTDISSQVVQQGHKCMVNLVRTQNTRFGESNYIEIACWLILHFVFVGVFSSSQTIPAKTFISIFSGEPLTNSTAKFCTL
jgi:histone-lysine N-methyltransferase SUV39H